MIEITPPIHEAKQQTGLQRVTLKNVIHIWKMVAIWPDTISEDLSQKSRTETQTHGLHFQEIVCKNQKIIR